MQFAFLDSHRQKNTFFNHQKMKLNASIKGRGPVSLVICLYGGSLVFQCVRPKPEMQGWHEGHMVTCFGEISSWPLYNAGFPLGDSSKDLFEISPGAPWSLKTLERAPWFDKRSYHKSKFDSFLLHHNSLAQHHQQVLSDFSSRAQCHQVCSKRVCFVLSG